MKLERDIIQSVSFILLGALVLLGSILTLFSSCVYSRTVREAKWAPAKYVGITNIKR